MRKLYTTVTIPIPEELPRRNRIAEGRRVFTESELGRFVEENRIGYYIDSVWSLGVSGSNCRAEMSVVFNVDDDAETLLRLRANGEVVFVQ